MRHRVLLVREWDSQTSGSGCCGRLGGVNCAIGDAETYRHTRIEMERMGAVYRALRDELGDAVEITVVDPRNMIWLVPALWRDGRARGFGTGRIWREVRRGVSYNAVIANGRTLFAGHVPEPQQAVDAVLAELAASTAAGHDAGTGDAA
jgi:hypothetical protein